jgi:hypothetical protein
LKFSFVKSEFGSGPNNSTAFFKVLFSLRLHKD